MDVNALEVSRESDPVFRNENIFVEVFFLVQTLAVFINGKSDIFLNNTEGDAT